MATRTCGFHRVMLTVHYGAEQRFEVFAYLNDEDGTAPNASATGIGGPAADFLQSILDKLGAGYRSNTAICFCTEGPQIVPDERCAMVSLETGIFNPEKSASEPRGEKRRRRGQKKEGKKGNKRK